jgi:hypothetical protein
MNIYNSVILPTVLYRLKDEQRLRVSEDKTLRRISLLKRVEVITKIEKMHNEELPNFHSSSYINTTIRSGG